MTHAYPPIDIDDSVRNIAAAHELGIFTVLVAAHGGVEGPVPGADVVVQNILQLPHVLPEIFLAGKQQEVPEAEAVAIAVTV